MIAVIVRFHPFFSWSNCIFLAFYGSFSCFILLSLIVQRIRSYSHVFCAI